MKVEYKVRPVTRFIVTRYFAPDNATGSSETKGEFDNFKTAHAVAYALAQQERRHLNLSIGDESLTYPQSFVEQNATVFTLDGNEYLANQIPVSE